VLAAIDAAIKRITNKSPLDEIAKAIAEAAGKGIEGALFERFMRALPSWVPVGRKGYGPDFVYDEDGSQRKTQKEEEREVEGALTASYQMVNDIPLTQWTRYARWAFHVHPLPGYRHLIGPGNAEFGTAEDLPDHEKNVDDPLSTNVLDIYKFRPAKTNSGRPDDRGSIECLWDTGAFSDPFHESGFHKSHGVMFHQSWPYWPMPGAHFWATGRLAYDCMRPLPQNRTVLGPDGKTLEQLELFPTLIHACKAFAVARFEGALFPENKLHVPAVRFFFMSGSEGGYVDNHEFEDRDGGKHDSPGFRLNDRDYEFIVDLPPRSPSLTPFPIGHTTEFMRNTIVLRPRLLMHLRFAPFVPGNRPPFRANTKFHTLAPRIELLPPTTPGAPPTQAKVTVPMTELPKFSGNPEIYAFDLSLGWHDPTGVDAKKVKRVTVTINDLKFHRQSGDVRFKSGINGRWEAMTADVDQVDFDQDEFFGTGAAAGPRQREVDLFLPEDARLLIHTHGTYLHGFGEQLENDSLASRRLRFGGLIPIPQEMQDLLDTLNALVAAGQQLTPEQQQTLDDIKEFLDRLGQFVGVNKDVEWLFDIDTVRDTQKPDVEKQRVSILARELWLKLMPLFNVQNVPVGFTTFINFEHSSHPFEHGQAFLNSAKECGVVRDLVKKRQELGQPVPIKYVARQWEVVGSGNLLGERRAARRADYSYSMLIDVKDIV